MSGKDVRLDRLMDLAEKWYPKKKFSHAMRVAGLQTHQGRTQRMEE